VLNAHVEAAVPLGDYSRKHGGDARKHERGSERHQSECNDQS
jgi:hypothetical protein